MRCVRVRLWRDGSRLADAPPLYCASYYDREQGLTDSEVYAARVHDWHALADRVSGNYARKLVEPHDRGRDLLTEVGRGQNDADVIGGFDVVGLFLTEELEEVLTRVDWWLRYRTAIVIASKPPPPRRRSW
jgi:hypothetical protein